MIQAVRSRFQSPSLGLSSQSVCDGMNEPYTVRYLQDVILAFLAYSVNKIHSLSSHWDRGMHTDAPRTPSTTGPNAMPGNAPVTPVPTSSNTALPLPACPLTMQGLWRSSRLLSRGRAPAWRPRSCCLPHQVHPAAPPSVLLLLPLHCPALQTIQHCPNSS